MEITVNKQSSIRITEKCVICFDPLELDNGITPADYIFITHNHFDHFSPDDINKILKDETVVIAPEAMASEVLKKVKVNAENCIFVTPSESFSKGDISFDTVPAYNKIKLFHPKSAGWCGYAVKAFDKSFYVMGDSDFTDESSKVKCDYLFIPVGGTYTMNYKDASKCAAAIKPKTAIPTHYGSIVGKPEDGQKFKELLNSIDSDIKVELKI